LPTRWWRRSSALQPASKIIERLKGPGFTLAFTAKGRLNPLLETIPVRVILKEKITLLGAGRCAAR